MHIPDEIKGSLVNLRDLGWRQNLASSTMEILQDLHDVFIERTMNFTHNSDLFGSKQLHQAMEVLVDLARCIVSALILGEFRTRNALVSIMSLHVRVMDTQLMPCHTMDE